MTLSKPALRQKFLQQRHMLRPEERQAAAQKVCDRFFDEVGIAPGKRVAGYWPVRSELDDLPILRELLRRNHACALPSIEGEGTPLTFRAWTPSVPMKTGTFSIAAPDTDKILEPDLILVPLVAFDRKGCRLGYGAGFYDRTIADMRKKRPIVTVGIAYDFQGCDALPAEAHDIRMDVVVTDKNVYRFGAMAA